MWTKGVIKRIGAVVLGIGAGCLLAGGVAFAAEKAAKSDPYPLDTCPVSGQKLGKKAVAKDIDGREIKFCCAGCPDKFTADKEANLKKVDEAIIKAQKDVYPIATCPVSGKEFAKDAGVDAVLGNRLVRFCCDGCPEKAKADPAQYLAKLDESIIAAQKDSYPLDTCLVADEKLGEMGEPVDVVIENRLVRLCCAGCEKKLRKNPAEYLSKLDKAEDAKSKTAKQ